MYSILIFVIVLLIICLILLYMYYKSNEYIPCNHNRINYIPMNNGLTPIIYTHPEHRHIPSYMNTNYVVNPPITPVTPVSNGHVLPAATTPTAMGYQDYTSILNNPAYANYSSYEIDNLYRNNLKNMVTNQYNNDINNRTYQFMPEPTNFNNMSTSDLTNYYPKQIYSQYGIASIPGAI